MGWRAVCVLDFMSYVVVYGSLYSQSVLRIFWLLRVADIVTPFRVSSMCVAVCPSCCSTPQLQQWDPPTTLPAQSEDYDEANKVTANPQPRQTPGQYDRISRPDRQFERTDRPIDQRLTEGGENTSQHQPEPQTFPRPLLTVSASCGSEDEMKAETPEGNASRRYDYSHANKLFLDPGATGVGGPGSADAGDKGGGSRVPSDISVEDFDEITKEDAPR